MRQEFAEWHATLRRAQAFGDVEVDSRQRLLYWRRERWSGAVNTDDTFNIMLGTQSSESIDIFRRRHDGGTDVRKRALQEQIFGDVRDVRDDHAARLIAQVLEATCQLPGFQVQLLVGPRDLLLWC